ncbi:MAG: nitroreductase/quinone reductase family protein [Dehalococcoidia bacterium]
MANRPFAPRYPRGCSEEVIHMDATVRAALQADRVVDITTRGRSSGEPRRIEIWAHLVGDRIFITGRPGKRSWYANMRAHPEVTLHVKRGATADIEARARPILDAAERREVLAPIVAGIDGAALDAWVEGAPLVELVEA